MPASEVIHILDPVEAGQLRGVSRFAAAVVKLFTLDLYDDAELERKKTAAMFAMFITSPAPENRPRSGRGRSGGGTGQVVRLDPGEDVTTPSTRTRAVRTSRSSTARSFRSARRWACPMAISPATQPRGTSRTRGSRSSTSAAASRPSSIP